MWGDILGISLVLEVLVSGDILGTSLVSWGTKYEGIGGTCVGGNTGDIPGILGY